MVRVFPQPRGSDYAWVDGMNGRRDTLQDRQAHARSGEGHHTGVGARAHVEFTCDGACACQRVGRGRRVGDSRQKRWKVKRLPMKPSGKYNVYNKSRAPAVEPPNAINVR